MRSLSPGFLLLFFVTMTTRVQNDTRQAANQAALLLRLEVFPEYRVGFPTIVAVTCYNPTPYRTYYHLPSMDLWTAPGPVAFTLVAEDGRRIDIPAVASREDDGFLGRFTLAPGASRRMLVDISNRTCRVSPGRYKLEARYRLFKGSATAQPVSITLVEPDEQDAAIAARLRVQNDLQESSWGHFILYNWRTIYTRPPVPWDEIVSLRAVDASALSEAGREALALHLFLHRAVYGPRGVAALNPRVTETFARGPLEGEAALLRLEILTARNDPAAPVERAAILERFPELAWRVEEIETGCGRLADLRQTNGVERIVATKPLFFPYTHR